MFRYGSKEPTKRKNSKCRKLMIANVGNQYHIKRNWVNRAPNDSDSRKSEIELSDTPLKSPYDFGNLHYLSLNKLIDYCYLRN